MHCLVSVIFFCLFRLIFKMRIENVVTYRFKWPPNVGIMISIAALWSLEKKILNTCSINSHFVIVYKSKWFFIKSRYHFYVKGLLFERSWFNRLSYNNHGIFTLNKELSVVLKPHPPALHLNILIDNSDVCEIIGFNHSFLFFFEMLAFSETRFIPQYNII